MRLLSQIFSPTRLAARCLPISLFLVISGLSTMAQDLDFPDFRSKKDNFSKINDKDIRADMASFALAGVDESIGKAQLQTVPVTDHGPDFMTFQMTISRSS